MGLQSQVVWQVVWQSHDGSMVLVYMLTGLGYIDGIHVTIYSSTMDPIWEMQWYQWHNSPAAHAFQACDTHSVSILHDFSTPTTHPTTSGNLEGVLCFLPPRVGCAIPPPQRR